LKIFGENLYVDLKKSEMNEKQKIDFEDKVGVVGNVTLMSHREKPLLFLQYGEDKGEIVLRSNKRSEIVECTLKSEMLSAMGKEEGLKQRRIVEIEDMIDMKTKNEIYEEYRWKRSIYSLCGYERGVWTENCNSFIQK
jgi:hypothetical protein